MKIFNMANNKKSFLMYTDVHETIKLLNDEQAGKLFKIIFSYVNDENPIIEDTLIKIVFEPIKQSLKRDLLKYESIRKRRSEAGKRSAEKRAINKSTSVEQTSTNSTSVESVEQTSTNPTVNDNVIVSDSVSDNDILLKKETKTVFSFSKELKNLGVDTDIIKDYLKVRTKKRASNTQTALKRLKKEIEKTKLSANEVITICVENSWSGFKSEWIDNLKPKEKEITFKKSRNEKTHFNF